MPTYEARDTNFELIPEGTILAAKVKSIEESPELKFGKKLNWKFLVTEEGPYDGYTINGSTSDKFVIHEKAKLTNWAGALLGRVLVVGDKLNTDDLIDLPCRIMIEHQPDREDPEQVWMRAGEVMPPRGASGAEAVFG